MSKQFEKVFDDLYVFEDMCQCFLLLGSEKNLLVDTGAGLKNIKKALDEITDKPVVVVNTHAHFDHFGGNMHFDKVLVHKDDQPTGELHNAELFRKYFLGQLPFVAKLLLKNKLGKPIALHYEYVDGNSPIDLGDRTIHWIHTPGHTPGSCCLLDDQKGYLFGGDTVVPKMVLLNLDFSLSPEILHQSMKALKEIQSQITTVFPGHHERTATPSLIDDYLEVTAKAKIEEGTIVDAKVSMAKVYANQTVQVFCKVDHI